MKKTQRRSEAELLALGGIKNGPEVVFGAKGVTQLVFTPDKRAWRVGLLGKPTAEEIRRELCKAGRGLWNDSEQKPDIAFRAVESLLLCWEQFEGFPSNEQQSAHVQRAISATLGALKRDTERKGRKLQLAFELLSDDQWPQMIDRLQEQAMLLAAKFQRPPSKKELKEWFDPSSDQYPQGKIHTSEFAKLLKHAGLAWLRRQAKHAG